MNAGVWRAVALSLIAVAAGFVLYQMTLPDREDFGLTFRVPRENAGAIVVKSVEPGSPAAKAGLHPGDTVWYGNTAIEKARAIFATPGSHVDVIVNGSRHATLVARSQHTNTPWIAVATRLAFLFVAALLAWRRPQDRATRSLVVFLTCYGLAISMPNGVLPNPLLSLLVTQNLTAILFVTGTAALARFAADFPNGDAQPVPRRLASLAQILAAAIIVALCVGQWIPRTAPGVSLLNLVFQAAFLVIAIFVLAALIVGYVQGAPSERQRRRWVFLVLGIGICGPIVDVFVQAIYGSFNKWVDALSILPLAVLPFGLAYVILRHRVIDVGFVVNRAVVYTIVSTLIVGTFVVAETLLNKYVEHESHVASLALQLGLTLALAFSVRFIHARVDRLVDTLLFRERHAAEAAIRNFANDASYITDPRVLFTRTVQILERYGGARGAGIWTLDAHGLYTPADGTFETAAPVDENDAAVLAMRSRRVIVDLRDSGSALPGALGFPMIVRGELIGVMVCGQKRDDETYAPDERDALAALATNVAHALDAIEIRELRRRLAEAGVGA